MARHIYPRRGTGTGSGLGLAPSLPAEDRAVLAELAGLRETLAGLERRLAEPKPDAAAIGRSIDALRKRMDELVAGQAELRRRLDETARSLASSHEHRRPRFTLDESRRLLAAMLAYGQRLGKRPHVPAASAPPATAPTVPAPQTASSWLLAGAERHAGRRAVLAVVLGLSQDEHLALAARLTALQDSVGTLPVFLTDSSDFAAFRAHQAMFEYMPDIRRLEHRSDDRDWELYMARRFSLICAKWQPVRVVAFGPQAARRLADWAASKHISELARELLAARDDDRSEP